MRANVIDGDAGRRAQIATLFSRSGDHVELFENVEEFQSFGPAKGYVLAYDGFAGEDTLAVLAQYRERCGYVPVVMYSDKPEIESAIKAMLAGALDYLEWPLTKDSLKKLSSDIRERAEVHQREEMRKIEARQLIGKLTQREQEVLASVAQGHGNKQIGFDLGISARTVEVHRAKLFKKINAGSTADAVRIAIYGGLDRSDWSKLFEPDLL